MPRYLYRMRRPQLPTRLDPIPILQADASHPQLGFVSMNIYARNVHSYAGLRVWHFAFGLHIYALTYPPWVVVPTPLA